MTLTPAQVALAQELKHASHTDLVEFVTELVIGLKWTIENKRELGHLWGMGPRELGRIGREADAAIFSKIRDPEELRSKLMEQAQFVVTDCLQKKKHFVDKNGNIVGTPDPDHKAAFSGLQFIAKMAGVDKPKVADEVTGKYSQKNVAELLAIAQSKLLPEGQPLSGLEIEAVGEEAHEEEVEADKVAVPNPDRRHSSEERIRGGNTRRDRDPTGRGRGLSQEGRET